MKLGRRTILTLSAGVVASGVGIITLGKPNWAVGVHQSYASSSKPPVFNGHTDGVAINGYDTVAYFTEKKPVKGTSQYSTEWRGTMWHFSNAENLEAFKAQPAKYAPQYGGYCSYAVSQGYTAKTEPEAWTIVDGKLYLNYSLRVKGWFDADKQGYINQANANWPKVLN